MSLQRRLLYLVPLYMVTAVLFILQWSAALHYPSKLHLPLAVAIQVVLFGVFIAIGNLLHVNMRSIGSFTVSGIPMVASLLLFPAPYPATLTFNSLLIYYVLKHRNLEAKGVGRQLYRDTLTICVSTLTVIVAGAIINQWQDPTTLLSPVGTVVAWLPLMLLPFLFSIDIPLYGLASRLDTGAWGDDAAITQIELLSRVATVAFGVVFAQLWRVDPWSVALIAVPAGGLKLATLIYNRSRRYSVNAEQRARSLEVVLTAAQQLAIKDDPIALLRPIAEAAREVTDADDVAVYGPPREGGTEPGGLELLYCLQGDQPECPPPTHVYLNALGRTLLHAGDNVYLVPIGHNGAGRSRACLRIAGASIEAGSEIHHTLAILSIQAAAALENADAHQRALTQASEDGLTKLLNHRSFQIRLQQEVARARRGNQPLALMMIDLDDFSSINNTYGHQIGDAALIAVADTLRATVREGDIPARYAGDEFTVILPATDGATARVTAERLCAAVCALRVRANDNTTVPIGCSVGVASLSTVVATREALIKSADQAAYAAKRSGKGTVAGEKEVLDLPNLADEPYQKRKAI